MRLEHQSQHHARRALAGNRQDSRAGDAERISRDDAGGRNGVQYQPPSCSCLPCNSCGYPDRATGSTIPLAAA